MPKIIENVREVIIEKAYYLFIKEGYDQVKTSRIAQECNIAAGTLFNYFPTKWDLLIEILRLIKQKGYEDFAAKFARTNDSYELVCMIVGEMHYIIERIGKLGKDFFIYLLSQEESEISRLEKEHLRERERVIKYFKKGFPQLQGHSDEVVWLAVRSLQAMVIATYHKDEKVLERNKMFICRSFIAIINNLDNIQAELQEVK
ncbi:MAG: TetR/AcrR family transcriptional regulator [Candidatus Cloacimonetes bacterium]|nr:TetR/AcrR family transcriptional regulator [Candidatus Cloacimonadota bacterium]